MKNHTCETVIKLNEIKREIKYLISNFLKSNEQYKSNLKNRIEYRKYI